MEEWIVFVLLLDLALVLALLCQAFLFQIVRVKGSSMEGTLHSGEWLLVSRRGTYKRGDVVLCRYPRRVEKTIDLGAAFSVTQHTVFVKRLAALPGDTVEIRDGQLLVSGKIVPAPAAAGSLPRDFPCRALGPNEYFVMGDNRFSSHYSRAADVGPLPRPMLQGRVQCVLWPVSCGRKVK